MSFLNRHLLFPMAALLGCLLLVACSGGTSQPGPLAPATPTTAGLEAAPPKAASAAVAASPTPASTPALIADATAAPATPASTPALIADATAAPAATPAPTVPAPTPSRPPPAESFPPAPDRDLYCLALELLLPPGHPKPPRVVNAQPVSYAAGRTDRFWLVDLDGLEIYQSDFELRLVTPHAYWYVEDGQQVEQSNLERAAQHFEEIIYPRVAGYFGQAWTPGVDNDPHISIVHGRLRGAAGYFSSTDEYPQSVRPRSNQREMIYIDSHRLPVDSDFHRHVLAHELQHAIHWNHDASEETWISEGLAELAVTVTGYSPGSIRAFMRRPFVSLVHWPLDDANIGAHYGGASLFMHYLAEHYPSSPGSGGVGNLRPLQDHPEDGIAGVDAYLEAAGYNTDFHAVFQDWVAANFLDEAEGVYGYGNLTARVQESRTLHRATELEREVAQYGTHYFEISSSFHAQPLRLRFQGTAENRLLPVAVAAPGCWWSNSGDSITSSLTRSVDLRQTDRATLTYQVWYSLEEDWDYVYLQVSRDGGKHWDILETPRTSAANPVGTAFGPGYTGSSRGWVEERVDLSDYAGQEITVRFQYVTDDALNDIGLCLRRLAIPEAGLAAGSAAGAGADDMNWQPRGFIHIDNRVRQDYVLQVLQKGAENRVTRIPLTPDGSGGWVGEALVEPYPGLEHVMVAVSAFAPSTRLKAPYQLSISEAGP